MAAIVQKGTALKIGFGSQTYTGHVMQSQTLETTGTQKVLKGEDNQTLTVLVEDLGSQLSFEALILDSGGSLTPPAQGSTVTINSVAYRTLSSSIRFSAEEAMLSWSGIKEASMTYS